MEKIGSTASFSSSSDEEIMGSNKSPNKKEPGKASLMSALRQMTFQAISLWQTNFQRLNKIMRVFLQL